MAKTKKQKKDFISDVSEKLSKSSIAMVVSFAQEGEKGLGVNETQKLKKSLKEAESEYVVGKKRIVDIVLTQSGRSGIKANEIGGSVGIVFGYGDVILSSKTAYDFSKKNKAFKLLGAFMNGDYVDQGGLISLAQLPGREVLLGRAIGMMNYPLLGMMNVLKGNIKNLVAVLHQIQNKK